MGHWKYYTLKNSLHAIHNCLSVAKHNLFVYPQIFSFECFNIYKTLKKLRYTNFICDLVAKSVQKTFFNFGLKTPKL